MAFDFTVVARAVLHAAVAAKKAASNLLKRFVKGCRTGWFAEPKKPHQLVLELDSIAQIPMIFSIQGATP